jgi:phage shock protein A
MMGDFRELVSPHDVTMFVHAVDGLAQAFNRIATTLEKAQARDEALDRSEAREIKLEEQIMALEAELDELRPPMPEEPND